MTFFNERYPVDQYVVDLRSELDALHFLAPHYRSQMWPAETHYPVGDAFPAVIQAKHGSTTLGLLTAGPLCQVLHGYASSFRSGCATPCLPSLEPVSSSLRSPFPVFAANAGIGTKSPPAVNWRNSPEDDAEDACSFA